MKMLNQPNNRRMIPCGSKNLPGFSRCFITSFAKAISSLSKGSWGWPWRIFSVFTIRNNWSVYYLKKMLIRFMVKQAVEHFKPVFGKSAATQSRAGMTLSIDNSVMDRLGKFLRCTWSWYSGRYHKVIRGQDLLGIVFTINHMALPLHLLFCPKQGRYHTNKADILIF